MTSHQTINHNERLMQSLFLVPTKKQVETGRDLAQQLEFENKKHRAAAQKSAAFAVDRDSLVKRGESPTSEFQHEIERLRRNAEIDGITNSYLAIKKKEFEANLHTTPVPASLPSRKTYKLSDYLKFGVRPEKAISANSKTCVRLYAQQWSGKFRFGLETGALGAAIAPPETSGERQTDELTKNATKNILESGAYMSAVRGGYTTFLTLTFDESAREKIKSGETTIGKEVSRFFDGAQKIYQRGMSIDYFTNGAITETVKDSDGNDKQQRKKIYYKSPVSIKFSLPMVCPEKVFPRLPTGELKAIPAFEELEPYNPRKHIESDYLYEDAIYNGDEPNIKGAPLDYMWVAEMPLNADGEINPHVHVMMRWKVKRQHFDAWAARLENLWGNGFAKLERIHTPQAASNYLLKAVGYMTKGSSSNQGTIKGNRYNISASARAPKWECIGEFFADNFIAILGELREKLHRKKARIQAQKIAVIQSQDKEKALVKKLQNINKKTPSEKRQAYIATLKGRLLEADKATKATSEQLGELPFINEFALGNLSAKQANNFLHWAMRERYWNTGIEQQQNAKFTRLKQETAQAIKGLRSHYRGAEHLLLTSELTWQWAMQDAPELHQNNTVIEIDENGNCWELEKAA